MHVGLLWTEERVCSASFQHPMVLDLISRPHVLSARRHMPQLIHWRSHTQLLLSELEGSEKRPTAAVSRREMHQHNGMSLRRLSASIDQRRVFDTGGWKPRNDTYRRCDGVIPVDRYMHEWMNEWMNECIDVYVFFGTTWTLPDSAGPEQGGSECDTSDDRGVFTLARFCSIYFSFLGCPKLLLGRSNSRFF